MVYLSRWFGLFFYLLLSNAAFAQITPDETLGSDRSRVIQTGPINVEIDQGARRGGNLFHSFSEFNVPDQGSVYFRNPAGVERILSRVTGTDVSDILGTLGVLGNADLFLLNPNGILFGPNAQLDLRGSFLATTANGFAFPDGSEFSAINPQAPPLLAINVPIGLQYGTNAPGALTLQGSTLRVNEAQSLILAGGAVALEAASLSVALLQEGQVVGVRQGGRIDLGAIAGAGTLALTQTDALLSLGFPENLTRADVRLTNTSNLDVRANHGGDLAISARNIDILGESKLLAGISEGLGFVGSQAGGIQLDATEAIRMNQQSSLDNIVGSNAIGNAGNIEVITRTLQLGSGAQLNASTFGRGDAGNVTITVRDRASFDGGSVDGQPPSGAFSDVESEAVGTGGNVEIITGTLQVSNGALLSAATFGRGDAGNVTITVRDRVSFDGESADGELSSGAYSSVEPGAIGMGGSVEISTRTLQVSNGAQIGASTFGQGDAGNITITVRDRVSFNGTTPSGQFSSGALSRVERGAIGTGGNVAIITDTLRVSSGAQIITSTLGIGNAGDIIITARDRVVFEGDRGDSQFPSRAFSTVQSGAVGTGGNIEIITGTLQVSNGALLNAETRGRGDAGNIIITARDRVIFNGRSTDGQFGSDAFSSVASGAVGTGGNVEISTGILQLSDGAQLVSATFGEGNAGGITITARDRIIFEGTSPDGQSSSGIFSSVQPGAVGTGGNVEISTGTLLVDDGAGLSAATRGRGDAGNIIIHSNRVQLSNRARISLRAEDTENRAGGLTMLTEHLEVDEGTISVSNPQGQAGRLTIRASEIRLNNGQLTAETGGVGAEAGADIRLLGVDRLQLQSQSLISAQATDSANGGNVTINAGNGFVVANLPENNDIIARAERGDGGLITITAQGIVGLAERNPLTPLSDINASSDFGAPGSIVLNIPDIDPSQGLVELPVELVDSSQQVAQGCASGGDFLDKNRFVVIGRGGLPANPVETLPGAVSVDLGRPIAPTPTTNSATPPDMPTEEITRSHFRNSIIEAQGWRVDEQGNVVLIADAAIGRRSPLSPLSPCPNE